MFLSGFQNWRFWWKTNSPKKSAVYPIKNIILIFWWNTRGFACGFIFDPLCIENIWRVWVAILYFCTQVHCRLNKVCDGFNWYSLLKYSWALLLHEALLASHPNHFRLYTFCYSRVLMAVCSSNCPVGHGWTRNPAGCKMPLAMHFFSFF